MVALELVVQVAALALVLLESMQKVVEVVVP